MAASQLTLMISCNGLVLIEGKSLSVIWSSSFDEWGMSKLGHLFYLAKGKVSLFETISKYIYIYIYFIKSIVRT